MKKLMLGNAAAARDRVWDNMLRITHLHNGVEKGQGEKNPRIT